MGAHAATCQAACCDMRLDRKCPLVTLGMLTGCVSQNSFRNTWIFHSLNG